MLYARNGQGKAYGVDNASDYYIGVLVDDGETPRIFLIENSNPSQAEYWSKTYEATEKWTELPIGLDRASLREKIGITTEVSA
ncbi:hypothetical protein [Thalassobacillus sp. CUG 92003]|uniref:hypothetical protein n=1 Tax=Thalassobacillus sp. CUG 92003 TaxID=2736641 RepID=UPI0015E69375|nr:hypothetical protein [Thalassobacillus sp. CUG 92003]